ncbi:hypothetical protein QOZ80_3BG0256600 [Eleusine coracana subsp. coracana]|nr:hypothetical protein QOZ80_3BG0256600 [Eleusine coracana subsp. coracana]
MPLDHQQNESDRSAGHGHCSCSSQENDGDSPAEATSTWTGEKRAKIQIAATSGEDLSPTARDDGGEQPDERTVHVVDHEQDLLEQIEGIIGWDYDKLKKETDYYVNQLAHGPPNYDEMEIWGPAPEGERNQQFTELMTRLAIYRIRAHEISKGARIEDLDDARLREMYPLAILQDPGFYKWREEELEWHFDPEYFHCVGLQDYQRLVPFYNNNGEYMEEPLESYRHNRCTPECDRQYVQFWEKLSNDTKWIEKPITTRSCAWGKIERVIYYQAVKIAADFPKMHFTLVNAAFIEYKWIIDYDYTFFRGYAWFYFEIWKRVAKQKMGLKEALEQLYAEDMPISASAEIEAELGTGRNSCIPGPVTLNYETYVACINGELEESDAHPLIMDAVKNFAQKFKMYYDYAKKKLEIAEPIGLIPNNPYKTNKLVLIER